MNSIKVYAPASIGNVGPGFDFLGLAVEASGDLVYIEKTKGNIEIEIINGILGISLDPDHNTAGIAARSVMKKLGVKAGLKIKLWKGIPPGSGMGSSAASAVAAGYATSLLFGDELGKDGILEAVTAAEEVVSGSFFCDNTACSLFGGLIMSRSYHPLEVIKLGAIDDLHIVIVKPDIEILTADSRKVLPTQVSFQAAMANSRNSCGIVVAAMKNDPSLFARSICDHIVEPARANLIPGFYQVKEAALKAGALGCSISGAGPAIFAVCLEQETAEEAAKGMVKEFYREQLTSTVYITGIDARGARVMAGKL